MPTLREWRHIVARGASVGLSHPDAGHRFEVVQFAPARLPDVLPCGLVQSGNGGVYTDATIDGADGLTTACQVSALLTLWLVVGGPLTEEAADVIDDLIGQLHGGALDACADDELNPAGFVPVVLGSDAPGEGEYGSQSVWWAPVRLLVPASS
jgi:hypothetical protein